MISFLKWIEQVAAAPAATTSASVAGSPGATTSRDVAPFLRPVGMDIVRRQYPGKNKRKRHRHK